jgi:hypothetical protein
MRRFHIQDASTGFGDAWRAVCFCIHEARRGGERVGLQWANPSRNAGGLLYEIVAELNGGELVEVLRDGDLGKSIQYTTPVKPCTLREPWAPEDALIAYQFDGCGNGDLKNCPPADLAALFMFLKRHGIEYVCMSGQSSVRELVRMAARATLFVGVDSGMAQLAHCMKGLPVHIIVNNQVPEPIALWHQPAIKHRTMNEFLSRYRTAPEKKICFVTSGFWHYDGWGQRLAKRLKALHPEIPTIMLPDAAYISAVKHGCSPALFVWDYVPDEFEFAFWIGCDCYPVQRFPILDSGLEPKFYAVQDAPATIAQIMGAGVWNLTARYFNGDVFIAHRSMRQSFATVVAALGVPELHALPFRDQSLLNMTIPGWIEMPYGYNWIPHAEIEPEPVYIKHFAGLKLEERRKYLDELHAGNGALTGLHAWHTKKKASLKHKNSSALGDDGNVYGGWTMAKNGRGAQTTALVQPNTAAAGIVARAFEGIGVRCPEPACRSLDNRVVDSRVNATRRERVRTRVCNKCGRQWQTLER